MQRLLFLLVLCLLPASVSAQNVARRLWQIGSIDGDYSEFALSPDHYDQLNEEGFYVIGQSDPSRDWPYVHPGPGDGWAGSKTHSFTVLFGIEGLGARDLGLGNRDTLCRVMFDLVDTHSSKPSLVHVIINDNYFEYQLPRGKGDFSILGEPDSGKLHNFSIEFPVHMLEDGNNELEIVNSTGSWFLYDAVTLEGPDYLKSSPVKGFIKMSEPIIEPYLVKKENQLWQNFHLTIKYAGEPKDVTLWLNDQSLGQIKLEAGIHHFKKSIPEITKPGQYLTEIRLGKNIIARSYDEVLPTGHKTIYILPHSHTDIGYTDIQTAIEDKQVDNLLKGIEYADQTSHYPEGAAFIWNVEVAWAADLYLNRLGENQKQQFEKALKMGRIALNGMYLNELTGLCRPEELLRLFRYSTQLAEKTNTTIDAAMISDVPGYTWGTVTAMAQAGIKYFSVAPNYFDRIGDILVQWENRPFYWVSPSGKEKVLVWIPFKGYGWSHTIPELNEMHANDFLNELQKMDYPYDIAYMRWSGHGDNSVPEPQICDFVKAWNKTYAWPRFIISSTSEAFSAFELKYGDQLKEYHGDWTPYWEDGAGSSALETAMNRNSADRLTQAAALWTISDPENYPSGDFDSAWSNALLYSEHTWGAWCSITDPENPLTQSQWAIKKGYADEAHRMSNDLLNKAIKKIETTEEIQKLTLINTTGWERNEPIIIDPQMSKGIVTVTDPQGNILPTQRLSTGELLVISPEVPAWSLLSIHLSPKSFPSPRPQALISGNTLSNGIIQAEIDPTTGNLIHLSLAGSDHNFVENKDSHSVNQYLFFEGNDLNDLETSRKPEIEIIENGSVFGMIEVRSEAPGCRSLIRRYKMYKGVDYLEIENIVDKERAPMPEKIGDWYLAQNKNKESVNFAFPFHVPEGVMRLDLPIGSMIPWKDQIPSACKNWYTVGRYGDVSNSHSGITWITLDAPLVEVGELSANLVGSQTNPEVWRKEVEPTQTLYSWVMNNHWGTNYRQYQEGEVVFRYALRPHAEYQAAESYRLATSLSQPLIVVGNRPDQISAPVTLSSDAVVPLSLKPADDGSGFILRLYNPGAKPELVRIADDKKIFLSNTAEEEVKAIDNLIKMGGMELVTIKVRNPIKLDSQ